MAESPDAQLLLKKRARRRLMGAIAFAGLAAVVLPMVMDEEPKQQMQDVQIRIPGQDQPAFTSNPTAAKASRPVPAPVVEKPAVTEKVEAEHAPEWPAPKPAAVALPKPAEAPPAKLAEKVVEKKAEKVEKTPEKTADKPHKQTAEEAQRAAAILAGKAEVSAKAAPASAGGQYVILIGAFANAANVKQLEAKLSELGVKTYTEPLDSPEGKKTRVRAGPFTSRDAADKALDRMKRIGVGGVVSAKQ